MDAKYKKYNKISEYDGSETVKIDYTKYELDKIKKELSVDDDIQLLINAKKIRSELVNKN